MPVKMTKYTTKEILDELIEKYSLDENSRDALRKKITSICKQIDVGEGKKMTNLWDKAKHLGKGKKKPEHWFTENEKQRIYNSPSFKTYMSKICTTDEQKKKFENEVENERQAEQANQKEREYWETFDPKEFDNDYTHHGVTKEEVKQKKLEIMLEAVFLKFYEPIDEDLLESDMNTEYLTDYSADRIASKKRLEKNAYYKEKTSKK